MKNRIVSKYKYLYCFHLDEATEPEEEQIKDFVAIHKTGQHVVDYLKMNAFSDESTNMMRTYLVKDVYTEELVGFFSLKAGLVSYNEFEEGEKTEFETLPGVELALFAVNKRYKENHPADAKIGAAIFALVLDVIKKTKQYIGISTLYIFSLPIEKVINNYIRYGFKVLPPDQEEKLHRRLKPRFDESCIFMHMPI